MDNSINLVDVPGAVVDKISLSPTSAPVVQDPTLVKQRATKYDIALGEESPGQAALSEAIYSGKEQMVREQGTLRESMKISDAKMRIGKALTEAAAAEGRALSESERRTIYGLTEDDVKDAVLDPQTFLEKKYAQRVMDLAVSLDQRNPFVDAVELDPSAAFIQKKHFEDQIARKEIYSRILEDAEQKYNKQSWGGWLADQAKSVVPGYTWSKWNSINKEDVPGWLPGTEKGEVIKHIHSLPPEQAAREAKDIVDRLAKDNPSLALEFAQGLNQYTESQQFWDNLLIAGLDVATVAPLSAVKGVGKTAARSLKEGSTQAFEKAGTLVAGASLQGTVGASKAVLERSGRMLAGVTQALMRPKAGMEDVADALGDQAQASILTFFKSSIPDGLDTWNKMTKMIPSVFNAGEITQNGGKFFSQGAIKELQGMLERNSDLLTRKLFEDGIQTDKISPEMLFAAKKEIAERMKLSLPHTVDAVMNVNILPVEGQGPIAARFAEVTLGAPGGQTFDTFAQAAVTAKVTYGLGDLKGTSAVLESSFKQNNLYKIEELGNGYVIKLKTNVDETAPTYLDALKDYATKNPTPISKNIIGRTLSRLRTPDDLLPKEIVEAFNTSAYGIAGAKEVVGEILNQLSALKLSKDALNEIDTFTSWQASLQRAERGPSGQVQYGVASRTLDEFERQFFQRLGKQPTLEQAKLYFQMQQMNDIVWFGTNLQQYAARARAGYARWSFRHGDLFELNDIEAKVVSNIPWEKNTNVGIMTLKQGADGELEDVTVTGMMAARRVPKAVTEEEAAAGKTLESAKAQIQKLIDEGYRVFQVSQIQSLRMANEPKLKRLLKDQPDVRFIVAKLDENAATSAVKPLDPNMIPYTEGFRFIYNPDTNMIRQSVVRGNKYNKTMRYYGDRAVFQANNPEDAEIIVTALEKARKLFLTAIGKAGKEAKIRDTDFSEFDGFIRQNLPVNVAARIKKDLWKGLKQEGEGLDPRIPFVVTKVNQSTDQIGTKIEDLINREWGTDYRLERNKDVALDGYEEIADMSATLEREGIYRLSNEGSITNPVFKREAPDLLSARDAVEQMTTRYMRSHYTQDVTLQTAQRFVAEFSPVLEMSKVQAYRDPIEALLSEDVFRKNLSGEDALKVAAAKLYQERAIRFLGMKTQSEKETAFYVDKLLGDIEKKFQGGVLEPLSKIIKDYRDKKKDPVVTLRSLAFHTKLGMFNIRQLFLQPMTLASMAGTVGDMNIIKQTAGALWHMGIVTDRNLDGLIPTMEKQLASWGWKKGHFQEAVNLYKSSGYGSVSQSNVLLSDHLEMNYSRTRLGKFLFEDGLVFFNKGEGMNRKASLLGAYSEWRRDNPLGKLNDKAKAQILKRADLLNKNMGHQSRAYWQEGIKSIPTQFMGYTIRGMEQMFSKRLTTQEKARIIGVNSAIFGVPISIGGATGVLPIHEMYAEWAAEAGYDTNANIVASIFSDGLLGYASELAAGEPTNISDRFGPSGTSFFRDILVKDDKFFDVVSGPGGQTFSAMAAEVLPVIPWMWKALTEGEPPRPGAVWDVVKNNVSSIGSADKLFMGLMTGAYYSKRGNVLMDDDKQVLQGIFEAVIGFDPKRIEQIYDLEFIMKQRSETQSKLTPSMRGEIRDILDSKNTSDASALLDSFRAKAIAGGFTEDQVNRLINDEMKGKTKREKVLSRYKNIDVDKNEFATELLKKYQMTEEEAK